MQYNVLTVGNPNSGKTTLFNGLTGAKQQVGNWAGVTVEKRRGVTSILVMSSGSPIFRAFMHSTVAMTATALMSPLRHARCSPIQPT